MESPLQSLCSIQGRLEAFLKAQGCGARQDVGRCTRAQPAPAMPPSSVSTLAVPRRGREVLCTKPTVAPVPCSTTRLHLGLEHLLLHEGSDTAAYSVLRPGPAPALLSRCFLIPGLVGPPHGPALPGRHSPVLSVPVWMDDLFATLLYTELQGHGQELPCRLASTASVSLRGTQQVPNKFV